MVDVIIFSIQIDKKRGVSPHFPLELCQVRYFDHLVPRQARWVLGFNEKVRFKQEKTGISTTIVGFFWGVRDLLQPAKNGMIFG